MIAAAAALAAPGCGSKKALDQAVDQLIAAVRSNDFKAVSQISDPALMAGIGPEALEEFSRTVNKLGPLRGRTLKAIHVSPGKVNGTYSLMFARGEVELDIALRGGKIESFDFRGEALNIARQQVMAEKYAELAVSGFEFRTEDGGQNPGGNLFKSGSKIGFRFVVQGLKA